MATRAGATNRESPPPPSREVWPLCSMTSELASGACSCRPSSLADRNWMRKITNRYKAQSVQNRGYSATREEAMAVFKKQWSCPLLAQSGYAAHHEECPLPGVRRTSQKIDNTLPACTALTAFVSELDVLLGSHLASTFQVTPLVYKYIARGRLRFRKFSRRKRLHRHRIYQ
jgi:hypothetical protein